MDNEILKKIIQHLCGEKSSIADDSWNNISHLLDLRIEQIRNIINKDHSVPCQSVFDLENEHVQTILELLPKKEKNWLIQQLSLEKYHYIEEQKSYYKFGIVDAIAIIEGL